MLGDSPTRNPRVRKSAQTKTTFESVFYALGGRLSNHGKLIKRRGPRILEIFQGWNQRRTRFSSREKNEMPRNVFPPIFTSRRSKVFRRTKITLPLLFVQSGHPSPPSRMCTFVDFFSIASHRNFSNT